MSRGRPSLSTVTLHISHACNLVSVPNGGNALGRFAIVYCGTHEIYRTTTQSGSPDPVWRESVELVEEEWTDVGIRIEIYAQSNTLRGEHSCLSASKSTAVERKRSTSNTAKHHGKTFIGIVRLSPGELQSLVTPLAPSKASISSQPSVQASGEHPPLIKASEKTGVRRESGEDGIFEEEWRFLEHDIRSSRDETMEGAVARARRPILDSAHYSSSNLNENLPLPIPPPPPMYPNTASGSSFENALPMAASSTGLDFGILGQLHIAVTASEAAVVRALPPDTPGVPKGDNRLETLDRAMTNWQSTRLVLHIWEAKDLVREYGESVHVDVYLHKNADAIKMKRLSQDELPTSYYQLLGSTQAVYSFGENLSMSFDATFTIEGWDREKLDNPNLLLILHAISSKVKYEDSERKEVGAFRDADTGTKPKASQSKMRNGIVGSLETVIGVVEFDVSSWAAVQKQPLDSTHANSWFRLQSIDPTIFIDGTVNVRSRLRQEELTEDSSSGGSIVRKNSKIQPSDDIRMDGGGIQSATRARNILIPQQERPRGNIHASFTMVDLPATVRNESLLMLAAKDVAQRSRERTLAVLREVALEQRQRAEAHQNKRRSVQREVKRRHKAGQTGIIDVAVNTFGSITTQNAILAADEARALNTLKQIDNYLQKKMDVTSPLPISRNGYNPIEHRIQANAMRSSSSKIDYSSRTGTVAGKSLHSSDNSKVEASNAKRLSMSRRNVRLNTPLQIRDEYQPELPPYIKDQKSMTDASSSIHLNSNSSSSDSTISTLNSLSTLPDEDPPHYWRSIILERYSVWRKLGARARENHCRELPLLAVKTTSASFDTASRQPLSFLDGNLVNASILHLWGSKMCEEARMKEKDSKRLASDEERSVRNLYVDGCHFNKERISVDGNSYPKTQTYSMSNDSCNTVSSSRNDKKIVTSSDDENKRPEQQKRNDVLPAGEHESDLEIGKGLQANDDLARRKRNEICDYLCSDIKGVGFQCNAATASYKRSLSSYYVFLSMMLLACSFIASVGTWPIVILGASEGEDRNLSERKDFKSFGRVLLKASLLGATTRSRSDDSEEEITTVPALCLALQLLVVILATGLEAAITSRLIWWIDPRENHIETGQTRNSSSDLAPYTVLVFGLPVSLPAMEKGPEMLIKSLERRVAETRQRNSNKTKGDTDISGYDRDGSQVRKENKAQDQAAGVSQTLPAQWKIVHVAPVVDLQLLFKRQKKMHQQFEGAQQAVLAKSLLLAQKEFELTKTKEFNDDTDATQLSNSGNPGGHPKISGRVQTSLMLKSMDMDLKDTIKNHVRKLRVLEHRYLDIDEDAHRKGVDGAGCAFVTFASVEAAKACLVALSPQGHEIMQLRRAKVMRKGKDDIVSEVVTDESSLPARKEEGNDLRYGESNYNIKSEEADPCRHWPLHGVPACSVSDVFWENLATGHVKDLKSRIVENNGIRVSHEVNFVSHIGGGHPKTAASFATATLLSLRQAGAVVACFLLLGVVLVLEWAVLYGIAERKRHRTSNSSMDNIVLTLLSTIITVCFDGCIALLADELSHRTCLRHYRRTINEALSLVLTATASTTSHTLVVFLSYSSKPFKFWMKPNDLVSQFLVNEIMTSLWPLVDLCKLYTSKVILRVNANTAKRGMAPSRAPKTNKMESEHVAPPHLSTLWPSWLPFFSADQGNSTEIGQLLKAWARKRRPPSFPIHRVSFLVSSFATAVCLASLCPLLLAVVFPIHAVLSALVGALLARQIWHGPRQQEQGILFTGLYKQAIALALGGGGIGCLLGSCLVPLAGSLGVAISVYHSCSARAQPSYESDAFGNNGGGQKGMPALFGGGFDCSIAYDDDDRLKDGNLTSLDVKAVLEEVFGGKSILGPTLLLLIVMRVTFGFVSRQRREAFDSLTSNFQGSLTGMEGIHGESCEILTYHAPLPWSMLDRWEIPVKNHHFKVQAPSTFVVDSSSFLSRTTFCNPHADDWARCDPNGDRVLTRADIATILVEALAVRSPWPKPLIEQYRNRLARIARQRYEEEIFHELTNISTPMSLRESDRKGKFCLSEREQERARAQANKMAAARAKTEADLAPFPPTELMCLNRFINLVFERLDPTGKGYVCSSFLRQQMFHASSLDVKKKTDPNGRGKSKATEVKFERSYNEGHLSHLFLRIALNLGRDDEEDCIDRTINESNVGSQQEHSIHPSGRLLQSKKDKDGTKKDYGDLEDCEESRSDDELWIRSPRRGYEVALERGNMSTADSMAELATRGKHDNIPLEYEYIEPRKMPDEKFLKTMNQRLLDTPTALDHISNLSAINLSHSTFDPAKTLNFIDETFVFDDSLDNSRQYSDLKPVLLDADATRDLWLDGIRTSLHGHQRADVTYSMKLLETYLLALKESLEQCEETNEKVESLPGNTSAGDVNFVKAVTGNETVMNHKLRCVTSKTRIQESINWFEGAKQELQNSQQSWLADLSSSSYGFKSVGSIKNIFPREVSRAASRARNGAKKPSRDIVGSVNNYDDTDDKIKNSSISNGNFTTEDQILNASASANVELLMFSGVANDGRRVTDDLAMEGDLDPLLTLYISVKVNHPRQDEAKIADIPYKPENKYNSRMNGSRASGSARDERSKAFDLANIRRRGSGCCVAAKVFTQWPKSISSTSRKNSTVPVDTSGTSATLASAKIKGKIADKRICMVNTGILAFAQALKKPLIRAIKDAARPDDGPIVSLLRERGLRRRRQEDKDILTVPSTKTDCSGSNESGDQACIDLGFSRPFRVRVIFCGAKEGGSLASVLVTDVDIREALRDSLACDDGYVTIARTTAGRIAKVQLVTIASPLPGDEGLALAIATAAPQHISIHMRGDPITDVAKDANSKVDHGLRLNESLASETSVGGEISKIRQFESQFVRRIVLDGPEDDIKAFSFRQRRYLLTRDADATYANKRGTIDISLAVNTSKSLAVGFTTSVLESPKFGNYSIEDHIFGLTTFAPDILAGDTISNGSSGNDIESYFSSIILTAPPLSLMQSPTSKENDETYSVSSFAAALPSSIRLSEEFKQNQENGDTKKDDTDSSSVVPRDLLVHSSAVDKTSPSKPINVIEEDAAKQIPTVRSKNDSESIKAKLGVISQDDRGNDRRKKEKRFTRSERQKPVLYRHQRSAPSYRCNESASRDSTSYFLGFNQEELRPKSDTRDLKIPLFQVSSSSNAGTYVADVGLEQDSLLDKIRRSVNSSFLGYLYESKEIRMILESDISYLSIEKENLFDTKSDDTPVFRLMNISNYSLVAIKTQLEHIQEICKCYGVDAVAFAIRKIGQQSENLRMSSSLSMIDILNTNRRVVEIQFLCARDLVLERCNGVPDLFAAISFRNDFVSTEIYSGGVPSQGYHDTLFFQCSPDAAHDIVTVSLYDWCVNHFDNRGHQCRGLSRAFHAGNVIIDLQSITAPKPTLFIFDVTEPGAFSTPTYSAGTASHQCGYLGQLAVRVCTSRSSIVERLRQSRSGPSESKKFDELIEREEGKRQAFEGILKDLATAGEALGTLANEKIEAN